MRVDLLVFGLAAVNRLHVERVAQDEGNTFSGAEVGEPVPGEDAFDAEDEILPVGGNGFQQVRGPPSYSGAHDLSILV